MAAAVVTSRPLQNAHTALDLWVPEYQEIRGKMMTGHVEYQIVVVTTLPAFKSARHKPGDVVQFVVSKKYSEIEEFYYKLCASYPHSSLPPFPRKVLFVGEADIRERRAAFNDIVKSIAKDRQLAACPELLDFLGSNSTDFVDLKWEKCHVNHSEEGDFFKQEEPSDEAILHAPSRSQNKQIVPRKEDNEEEEEDEEEEEEEVDLDPLGILKAKTKKTKKPTKPKVEDPSLKPSSRLALFDEIDPDGGLFEPRKNPSTNTRKPFTGANEIKLFEEQDLGGTVHLGDSLLMPSTFKAKDMFKPSDNEDLDDLLRVEEGFEKLLNLEPKKKGKPPIPAKPSFTKVSGDSEGMPLPPAKREANIEAMDESDILRYITENEQAPSDSLF